MGKYDNKKLLILGTNALSTDAVVYAKRNGAYVYVADNLPVEKSEAKKYADETLNMSTANTDDLIQWCMDNRIDGVFSGISEFNILQAMKIQIGIGKSFYFSEDQWDLIEKKDKFRELCKRYGVPSPKTYFSGTKKQFGLCDRDWNYPVILKPVDASASDGVHICDTAEALEVAIDDAYIHSKKGIVIIEEFVEGYEFTAHYTIYNGKAVLSTIDNRYPEFLNQGNVTSIPIARIYPSLFIEPYINQVNEHMVDLCEGIGLRNAVLFVQGIYNEQSDRFCIFEAGLRCAAEAPGRYMEKLTGQNHYFLLLDTILGVDTKYDLSKEDPYMNGTVCGTISLGSRGGKVEKIKGLDNIKASVKDLMIYESRYPVGSIIPCGNSLRQIVLRFLLISKNREEMIEDINAINSQASVTDENEEDLLVRMESERIRGLR